jgi:ribonuclease D
MATSNITRDEMAALPLRRYEGEVLVATTPEEIEVAAADIAQERFVGFDTETRPSFRKGEAYPPTLVQIATARRVYLFRLRVPQVHEIVRYTLSAEHLVKAGVAVAHDLRTLRAVLPFVERNVVDLGVIARRTGMGQTGLRNLAGLLLGVRIPKGAKTTNWAASRLTPAQIAYAATDAWACRELYLRFEALGLLHGDDV